MFRSARGCGDDVAVGEVGECERRSYASGADDADFGIMKCHRLRDGFEVDEGRGIGDFLR